MSFEGEDSIRRWIAIQRYSVRLTGDVQREIERMMRELRKVLADEDYRRLVDAITKTHKEAVTKMVIEGTQAASTVYVAAEARAMGMISKPVTKAVVNRALTTTMTGQFSSPMDMITNLFGGVTQKAKAVIKRGFDEGRTIREMGRDFQIIASTTLRHAEAVARTATNAVANQAKMETFEANRDITDRYIWLSTLDARTSDICIALDRKIFRYGEGPQPPAHSNCRSAIAAVFTDESTGAAVARFTPRPAVEAGDNYKPGDTRTRSGTPRRPRKSDGKLVGKQVNSRTYETWLKGQKAQYQRDILGDTGYERFKKGTPLLQILRERTSELDLIGLEKALN